MNKKSALKFFLGGDISLYFARNANSIAGAQFSVGANYFFSKNIALEPTLSYSLTKPLSSQRSGAENNFKFSVELRNFYLKLHESVEDEDAKKDCTARNRIAIGGNLDATLDVDDKYVLGINFDANYGHFLAKNFLISASLGLGLENPTNFSLDDFSDRLILPIRQSFINYISIMAKYYIPVTKRFFVTPYLQTFYAGSNPDFLFSDTTLKIFSPELG